MSILDILAQIKNKEGKTGSLPISEIFVKFGPPISNETWLKFFDIIFSQKISSLNKDDFVLLYVISDYLCYVQEFKKSSSIPLKELKEEEFKEENLKEYINSQYISSSTLAIAGYLSGLIENRSYAYEYSQSRTGLYNSRISFKDMINSSIWNKRKRENR